MGNYSKKETSKRQETIQGNTVTGTSGNYLISLLWLKALMKSMLTKLIRNKRNDWPWRRILPGVNPLAATPALEAIITVAVVLRLSHFLVQPLWERRSLYCISASKGCFFHDVFGKSFLIFFRIGILTTIFVS